MLPEDLSTQADILTNVVQTVTTGAEPKAMQQPDGLTLFRAVHPDYTIMRGPMPFLCGASVTEAPIPFYLA
jgi:hypothetical protein